MRRRVLVLVALSALTTGCLGIPKGATAVEDFELERYLGTWYEIARLDHGFERGLSRVQAQYSLREDGGVRVINRGFDTTEGRWSEAEGKAYFIGDEDIGRLKVSFFGPFYGAYNIVELDRQNYSYALVTGPDTEYLWILARDPEIDPAIVDRLVSTAAALGFPVEELIFPEHDGSPT
jgi:apolipoprotein D and lipocalin family protein